MNPTTRSRFLPKYLRGLSVLGVAAAITACGGGGGSDSSSPAVPVKSGFTAPTQARAVTLDGMQQVVADRQFLVLMQEDVTPSQYDAVLRALKAQRVASIGERKQLRMLQVVLLDNLDEAAVWNSVRHLPGVMRVDYNFAVDTTRENPPMPPAGPLIADAPRMKRLAISSAGRYWVDQIGLPQAWAVEDALGVTQSARIAVVDTGVPAGQKVIDESRLTRVDAAGAALTDDSTIDAKDHGLWVSAFAAGHTSDASGVSRHANVLSVDVYTDQCKGLFSFFGCPGDIGRVFDTDLAEGALTALQDSARVVNLSWAREPDCDAAEAARQASQRSFREMLKPLVNLARRSDKLLVLAAGNKCEKRDDQLLISATDIAADSWSSHALIVGASTALGRDAPFSRMGAVVNIMAPGESMGWGHTTGSGTSYAAPLVVGAASILQGINNQLSAPETRYLLMKGAETSISFTDMKVAKFRGYTGPDATGPAQQLHVGNAAAAARLTRDARLQVLDTVHLALGQSQKVSFDVDIPSTGVRALDVVFVIDVSGSYENDIATFKGQAGGIVDALLARGIDVQFGVTEFADFPLSPYGATGDVPFRRLARLTADKEAVLAGINALRLKDGNDEAESQLEALYQAATGKGRDINGDGAIDATIGDIAPQPVGWRTGAAKVVLFATDARFHDSDTEPRYPGVGFKAAVAALQAQGIKVIALQSGTTGTAAADIARLVSATGGSSYQLSTDSARVAEAIAAGIDASLAEVDVTVESIAGAEWIGKITQDKARARPGEMVRFTAELTGQRNASIDALKYDLYLWVRANASALLQRVRIPVEVAP